MRSPEKEGIAVKKTFIVLYCSHLSDPENDLG